jgi:serine/threonine protein kinase
MTTPSTINNNSAQIWVAENLFIPVDAKGYATGFCPEGAFGHIVRLFRLKGETPEPANVALKIPRLRGDSNRENAYILQVLEHEETEVIEINDVLTADTRLVRSVNEKPLLREARPELRRTQDSLEQEGHVVFVSYEKGLPPRFVCIKSLSGQTATSNKSEIKSDTSHRFSIIPPGAAPSIMQWLTVPVWTEMEIHSRRKEKGAKASLWTKPVFQSRDPLADDAQKGLLLSQSLDLAKAPASWYAAIPSILFQWSEGTLQKAVSSGILAKWDLPTLFSLFEGISSGLAFLHKLGKLHCDIRPANIMAIGDPDEAASYVLGDYGSFSKGIRNFESPPNVEATDNTQIGPMVGRQRRAPFYSSERRTAEESEDEGDIAVVIRPTDAVASEDYFIYIGWASEFKNLKPTDPQNKEVWNRLQTLPQTISQGDGNSPKRADDLLCEGDRVRIGDIVLEVVRSTRTKDGNLLFRCKKRFARIIQERLSVIADEEELNDGQSFSISQLIEYRQWSAATDLYGMASVFLYCVFNRGESKLAEDSKVARDQRRSSRLFSELMEQLESLPYFDLCWEELDNFHKSFKEFEQKKTSESTLEKGSGNPLKGTGLTIAKRVFLAPHLKYILAGVDQNILYFLLLMHFTLSCLHRQSHLKAPTQTDLPFCKDRLEKPRNEAKNAPGVASRVLHQLRWLKGLIPSEHNKAAKFYELEFACHPDELKDLPIVEDQSQLTKALSENLALKEEKIKRDQHIELLKRKAHELEAAKAEIANLSERLNKGGNEITELQMQLGRAVTDLDKLSKAPQEIKSKIPDWKKRHLAINGLLSGNERKALLEEILGELTARIM